MNITSSTNLKALDNNISPKEDKKLKDTCKEFESLFLKQLLSSMRKTAIKSDLFGSSNEEEMFQDMMDTEVCNSAAKTNSMGIADMLYREFTKTASMQNKSEVSK